MRSDIKRIIVTFKKQGLWHEMCLDLFVEASFGPPKSYHLYASVAIAGARSYAVTNHFRVFQRLPIPQTVDCLNCNER